MPEHHPRNTLEIWIQCLEQDEGPAEHSLAPAAGFHQILAWLVAFAAFPEHPRIPARPWQRQFPPGGITHSPAPRARAGKHLGWEERECAELETPSSTSKEQREGGEGAQLCREHPRAAGGKRERSRERKEQEETREGNSAAWRHFREQDAWASPWSSSGKQLLSRGSSAATAESRGCPWGSGGELGLGSRGHTAPCGRNPAGSPHRSLGKGLPVGIPALKSPMEEEQGEGERRRKEGERGDAALVPMS